MNKKPNGSLKLLRKEKDLVKKVGKFRLIRKSIKVFNKLCKDCKQKAMKNPKITKDKYCKDCQEMIDVIMGPLC